MKRGILISLLVSLLIIVGITLVCLNQNDSTIKIRPEEKIYEDVHHMANSKIIAIDGKIWGVVEITSEGVDKLLTEVVASNYKDKQTLIDMLTRWKSGDFTHVVEDHNYIWKKLDGNVGYAIGIKRETNE